MLDFTSLFVEEVVAAKRIERELEAEDADLVRRIRAGQRAVVDAGSKAPIALPVGNPAESHAA